MAKRDLLKNYLKEDREELKLIEQVLAQREKRKKAEKQLRHALKINQPRRTALMSAKVGLLAEKKADEASQGPKQDEQPVNSIQIICLNCTKRTPLDVVRCINCGKNPRRKKT